MSLRRVPADCLVADRSAFRSQFPKLVADYDLTAARMDAFADGGDSFEGPASLDTFDGLDPWAREMIWRLWLLDDAPFGLTLSGPAYQDNPIRYANRTFRALTGYSMAELAGENPRLLQGPDTESGPVADLHEAIDIWEPVTVELTNYRRDGTTFRNRVSLVPVEGASGSVTNWLGIQQRLDE